MTDADREFLRRAIRLAMNGRGGVEPNPMVGCIIVKNGQVIGQGYHRKVGESHAEPIALESCTESPEGATVYVTLEPCCHTNKKTPPCVPRLIAAKLARVVVGCVDPNPAVSGRGIAQLREAGIETIDADDPHCRQLIAPFIATMKFHRPYVTLKWAQSADGKVAGAGGRQIAISNAASQKLVHQLRARCDAVMIGIGTASNDNPRLTARGVKTARPLIRAVLDSDLRLSVDSHLAQSARDSRVIIYCSKEAADYSGTRTPLAALGVGIQPVSTQTPGRLDISQALKHLAGLGVTHLLVEPGPTLARSFIEQNLADRIWIFHSPKMISAPTAPAAIEVSWPPNGQLDVDGDLLSEHLNPGSPVFFADDRSADFELAQDSSQSSG
ncbi:MAG TPA: bifunctional diaminohydroxyphosphoribosylaminopyrimidine deaminase/5-amino-6-(5-phosphoribosylamino)uracil reductase RibD [Humisphaera sp.]|jgi:diaminohydroxyphosphoribosylaminopyrimidine deaminase/5-amino-6-(5-phosphoribosylamino)uracil reductase|nr:bifunctional diaminohydroxyphosphoribosylaminopyrimidine deaminase/5-amino-6-(5-phosphoribosylamino)uracil reductase RibD [Humisphaera sp.]